MKNYIKYLICLNCGGVLSNADLTDSFIICPHCKKKWEIRDHRPIFTEYFADFTGRIEIQPGIIRERLHPRIYDFTFIMTSSYRNVFDEFLRCCNKKKGDEKLVILDIGCGFKAFAGLFKDTADYIGIDISLNSYADFIADSHKLPFAGNTFDVIIASEVLEHTLNEYQLIEEIRRVAKAGCTLFMSLPFVFPEHGAPFDFQRFTKYKLNELFRKDEIIRVQESNNFISTLIIFPNILLKSAFPENFQKFFYPFFFINNLLSLLNENIWNILNSVRKKCCSTNLYFIKIHRMLNACPLGYSLIIRINKGNLDL